MKYTTTVASERVQAGSHDESHDHKSAAFTRPHRPQALHVCSFARVPRTSWGERP